MNENKEMMSIILLTAVWCEATGVPSTAATAPLFEAGPLRLSARTPCALYHTTYFVHRRSYIIYYRIENYEYLLVCTAVCLVVLCTNGI